MKQWKNPELINLSVNKTNEDDYKHENDYKPENELEVTNIELRYIEVNPS